MKNTLNYLGILLVGIIIGIVCSIVVRSHLTNPIRKVITDTTTVIKYDTIRIAEPDSDVEIPLTIKVYPIAQVPTLLAVVDTMKIPYIVNGELIIPLSQKYYRSPQYQAWVSGYNPKLDSIIVSSITYNHAITQTINYQSRWELSLEARLLAAPNLFIPSVGIRYSRDGFFAELGALYYKSVNPYLQVGYSVTLFR